MLTKLVAGHLPYLQAYAAFPFFALALSDANRGLRPRALARRRVRVHRAAAAVSRLRRAVRRRAADVSRRDAARARGLRAPRDPDRAADAARTDVQRARQRRRPRAPARRPRVGASARARRRSTRSPAPDISRATSRRWRTRSPTRRSYLVPLLAAFAVVRRRDEPVVRAIALAAACGWLLDDRAARAARTRRWAGCSCTSAPPRCSASSTTRRSCSGSAPRSSPPAALRALPARLAGARGAPPRPRDRAVVDRLRALLRSRRRRRRPSPTSAGSSPPTMPARSRSGWCGSPRSSRSGRSGAPSPGATRSAQTGFPGRRPALRVPARRRVRHRAGVAAPRAGGTPPRPTWAGSGRATWSRAPGSPASPPARPRLDAAPAPGDGPPRRQRRRDDGLPASARCGRCSRSSRPSPATIPRVRPFAVSRAEATPAPGRLVAAFPDVWRSPAIADCGRDAVIGGGATLAAAGGPWILAAPLHGDALLVVRGAGAGAGGRGAVRRRRLGGPARAAPAAPGARARRRRAVWRSTKGAGTRGSRYRAPDCWWSAPASTAGCARGSTASTPGRRAAGTASRPGRSARERTWSPCGTAALRSSYAALAISLAALALAARPGRDPGAAASPAAQPPM